MSWPALCVDVEGNIGYLGPDALIVHEVPHPVGELVGHSVFRARHEEPNGVRREHEPVPARPGELVVHPVQNIHDHRGVRTSEADVFDGDDLQSLPEQPLCLLARLEQLVADEEGVLEQSPANRLLQRGAQLVACQAMEALDPRPWVLGESGDLAPPVRSWGNGLGH